MAGSQSAPARLGPYGLSALLSGSALLAPLLVVEIPPLTDLPQQVAQIRLLLEVLGGEGESAYRLQLLDPNKLGYLPLLLGWLIAPPLAAARLGVGLIGAAWILGIHFLAFRFRRPPAAAAAASIFLLNHLLYWGILNFLLGLPVFCVLFVLISRGRRRSAWEVGLLAVLLYSAHVLWLAAASVALLGWLVFDRGLRPFAGKLAAGFVPAWVLVAIWYPRFTAAGFDSETTWGQAPWQRLHPQWLVSSGLGGLQGTMEGAVVSCLVVWLGLGLAQAWWVRRTGGATEPGDSVDRSLLATGAFFGALALCLPGVVQHTIFFASRWVPVAAVFVVLALPPPRLRVLPQLLMPLLLAAGLAAATAATWMGFEAEELDGFPRALAAVQAGERVLGLDLVRTSERIRGFPYYHLYAWTQVLHGNLLARSFANEASSLVVFRDIPRENPWTPGLDWRARQVRRSDIDHFRWILVHGEGQVQQMFQADERLDPIGEPGRWTLYRRKGPARSAAGSNSPPERLYSGVSEPSIEQPSPPEPEPEE